MRFFKEKKKGKERVIKAIVYFELGNGQASIFYVAIEKEAGGEVSQSVLQQRLF